MQLQEQWGAKLRSIRQKRNLSIMQLSREAEVDPSWLSKLERGLVGTSDDSRMRLAAALGVRVEEIWTYPAEVAS